MGTSVSQRSHSRGPWAAQHQTLGRNAVPVERQVAEIWRAAFGDRGDALADEFCSPEIVRAASLAGATLTARQVGAQFEAVLDHEDSGSLIVEFAKRSIVRSATKGAAEFGADLFAEAAAYYVSRDLPSYVGSAGRVATNAEAMHLKATIRERSRQVALIAAGEVPAAELATTAGWRKFVSRTAKRLAVAKGDVGNE